jgi:hypothetical protein
LAKAKKDPGTVQPEINIFSIEKPDFDFFPNMRPDNFVGQEQTIVKSMKAGTYTPFMGAVEYKANVGTKKQHKYLKSAEPILQEFSGSMSITEKISRDEFKAAMVEQQEKLNVKSRVEILNEQFKKSNIPLRPRYYHNPLQYFDHVLLSDGYVNSFGGTVIDTWSDFIMPKSLEPVLKIRNPEKAGDDKAQQKLIQNHQYVIDKLKAVDQWYSDLGRFAQDPFMDIPLHEKWKAMITNTLTFGRDTFILENWKHMEPVTVDGTEYKGLPNVVKVMHPIEMGMIELDDYTWKLGGMYVHNDRSYIPANQMVYLVNQYQSPMIGSLLYGFSKLQRALDPIRLLRRIFAQNYQQFIRNSVSGCGAFIFDSTQYPDDVRKKIRTAIRNSYVSGEIAVIDYANINDFKFESFNIDVKIGELEQLQEQLIKVTIGVTGIPQSLIFDEAAATRATLVGRIVSFINNQVEVVRTTLAKQIAAQWYMRIFREIYGKDEELLEQFYIDVDFEEMELETKLEKVGRLIQETQLNPYTDDYLGEELGDPDYADHIDQKKIDQQNQMGPMGGMGMKRPGGPPIGQKNFSVTDSSTGQSVNVGQGG